MREGIGGLGAVFTQFISRARLTTFLVTLEVASWWVGARVPVWSLQKVRWLKSSCARPPFQDLERIVDCYYGSLTSPVLAWKLCVPGLNDFPSGGAGWHEASLFQTSSVLEGLDWYFCFDSNCLFRALGDQLEGHSRNHLRHRQETVDYMIKQREDFEPFVEDDVPFEKHGRFAVGCGLLRRNTLISASASLVSS